MNPNKVHASVQRLIWQISHRMSRTYSIPIDEVHAQANLIFVESCASHNAAKSKFTTWLTNRLTWRLHNWCQYEYRRKPVREVEPEDIVCHGFEHRNWLSDFKAGLSDEARVVVDAVLSGNEDIFDLVRLWGVKRASKIRVMIRDYLAELGWVHEEINKGFREITEALSNGLKEPKKKRPKALKKCKLHRGQVVLALRRYATTNKKEFVSSQSTRPEPEPVSSPTSKGLAKRRRCSRS